MPEFQVTVTRKVDIIVSASDKEEMKQAIQREIKRDFAEWTFEDEDYHVIYDECDLEPEYLVHKNRIIHVDDY